MESSDPSHGELAQRVAELLHIYGAPDASAANLLCDRYPQSAAAYSLIGTDLSVAELSYGELRADSERFAAGLCALGIGPGDRVATLMSKSREYLVALMGIWRLGAVHVPLFTAFAAAAIAVRLRSSVPGAIISDARQQAKLALPECEIPQGCRIITTAEGADALPGAIGFRDLIASYSAGYPAAVLGGDAPLIQIYTSGTTGSPKGVVVPIRALASFRAYAEFALDLRPEDVFWNAADPGWAYGLYFGILATLTTGVRSVLYGGGFSPEATLEILSKQGVTNFTAAPTVYRALRLSGTAAKGLSLRCASSAGEPLTPDVNQWAGSALGVEVYDHYGQTETGMLINNHHHPKLRRPLEPGSMGHVMPGWDAALLKGDSEELVPVGEVGRLAIDLKRSPLNWFQGYVGDPGRSAEKLTPDGRWYLTGDLARANEQGRYYFSSRDDDVIIMAGYRIGPFEVESVLLAHPAVTECAVVAVPDEVRGEVLQAAVVLRKDYVATVELTKGLQEWVKSRYAAHAYPREIHYVDELPRTPSGKVQRFIIRQQLRERR